jgi:hypothetical protein
VKQIEEPRPGVGGGPGQQLVRGDFEPTAPEKGRLACRCALLDDSGCM